MPVNRKNIWWWLTGAGILALLLRLYHLCSIALWHDEAFSVLMVKYPFTEMLYRLTLDVHPPFYYTLFYLWDKIFSNSLLSLRLFSVIFGLLAIFTAFYLVKKIFKDRRLAYWVLIASVVNPFLILYSQEGRMYSLGLFLILAATACLWQAVKEKKSLCWVLFVIFSALACYTHYYLFFGVLGLFAFLAYLIWRRKESQLIKPSLISAGAIFLFYLPWIKYFLAQLKQVQEAYWIPKMTLWSVPNTLANLLTGATWPIGEGNWYWGLLAVLVILYLFIRGAQYLLKLSREGGALILFSLLAPFILAILLSLKQSLYLDRYFIFIVPYYLIFLVAGIYVHKPKWLKITLMIIFCVIMLLSYLNFWVKSDIAYKPGMKAAAAYLNIKHQEGEKILVTSSFVFFTHRFYNRTNAKALLYAPGEMSHFSGTALLDREDIVKSFKEFATPGEKVWLISTSGFGNFRSEPPESWRKIEGGEFKDSNSVKGSIFVEEYQIK